MNPLTRWFRLLKMMPPVLGASMPGLGPWLARRRWPRAEGTMHAEGLEGRVEVIRDHWGVPHIFASNEHDLFFAQGYVHAQDRLWQLEMGRRTGNGTLSAAVGPTGLPVDRLLRTLGLRRAAERSWAEQVDGDARAVLTAYAEGVNARLANEPLPIEFSVLGVTPEPWTPVDTLVRGNLLALLLGGNHRLELLRAQIVAEAGEEVAAALLPPHAPNTPLIVPPEARNVRGLAGLAGMEGLDGADRWLGDPNIVSGSNNWVVHGQRTASGKPLLCNDVHIGLGLPSTWYENGLHGGRFNAVGFSLPGVPLVIIGHNGRVAWGMSNLGPDTQDFYLEKVDDPQAPRRYEYQGAWHDLDVVREEIPVRGQRAPEVLEVRSTRHGPIMNEAMSRVLAKAEPMALRWALYDSRPLIQPLVQLNLATSWQDFRAALSRWESPGQNFVYADGEGHIAYQATGKIPIRAPGHQGLVPVPGWTGEYEWRGFIPFEELPASLDPPAGFVATANNKITSDDYPHLIAYNWFPGYRAERIHQLLAAGEKHTAEDMRRIQGETYSLPAAALRPYLAVVKPETEIETAALAMVQDWDLRFETDRVGASIFQAWYVHLLRRLLRHKLGPALAERYLASEYERHGSMHMPLVIGLMETPESDWFKGPGSGPGPGDEGQGQGKDQGQGQATRTRDEVVQESFHDAIRWLGEKYGKDPKGWRWGRVHTVTYMHSPLGRTGIGLLGRLFNSRTLPARGDNYTVDGASFLWSRPFEVVHGTAMRMIIDLGDLTKSVGIHTPGQCEHLYHPHRDDLMEMCQKVEYHPLLFTRQAVEAEAEHTLTLEPAPRPG